MLVLSVFSTNIVFSDDHILKSVTDSSTFDLNESRGKYIALHFLLKTECPICMKHTHDYFTKSHSMPNVIQVFLKPDTEKEIQVWAKNLKKNYPIYRDPNAQLAKRLKIPHGYKFHGQVVHYPATVLIDPKGNEVYRYIGKNNRDRLSFESLKKKVSELVEK